MSKQYIQKKEIIEKDLSRENSIINIPKSIKSNPNDISKIDCSHISENKIKVNIEDRNEFDKGVEKISNSESDKEAGDSNFSAIREICDELNIAEKYIQENKR